MEASNTGYMVVKEVQQKKERIIFHSVYGEVGCNWGHGKLGPGMGICSGLGINVSTFIILLKSVYQSLPPWEKLVHTEVKPLGHWAQREISGSERWKSIKVAPADSLGWLIRRVVKEIIACVQMCSALKCDSRKDLLSVDNTWKLQRGKETFMYLKYAKLLS